MRRVAACSFVIGITVMSGACATTAATPRPFPTPEPRLPSPSTTPAPRATAKDFAYSLTGTALQLRGTPYRNGGSDPSGFDCSGFVWYVFAQHGLVVPRTVSEQARAGRAVDPQQVQAGDLVFFSTVSSGASHVGIAIGGDEFIHAPSSTGIVRVERLSATYWAARLVAARRVI